MGKQVEVSVVVITYNHEKYIRQALNSILMQEVDFNYEILIGDDASIDSTPEILREYAEKYPDIIKLFLRKENLGGTRNSYELLMSAQGKYIANLEGDDYWTDKKKLQKQIDFLNDNNEFAGCVCGFKYVTESGEPYPQSGEKRLRHNLYSEKEIYTLEEFNNSKLPAHAGTLVYRNIYKMGIDGSVIYKSHRMIGDCTIIMLILKKGNIFCLRDNMSAYRFAMKNSSWTSSEQDNPFLSYNTFMYYNTVEKYGNEKLKMKVSLYNYKARYFFYMVMNYLDNKSKTRKQCLKMMLKSTNRKLAYFKIILASLYLHKIKGVVLGGLVDEIYKKYPEMTWENFKKECKDKEVVLFGSGGGCRDYLEKEYLNKSVKFIVDNSEKNHGKYMYGYKIVPPEQLKNLDKDKTAVIITTSDNYIEPIRKQVESYGIRFIYSYVHMECNSAFYNKFRKKYENKIFIKNV